MHSSETKKQEGKKDFENSSGTFGFGFFFLVFYPIAKGVWPVFLFCRDTRPLCMFVWMYAF